MFTTISSTPQIIIPIPFFLILATWLGSSRNSFFVHCFGITVITNPSININPNTANLAKSYVDIFSSFLMLAYKMCRLPVFFFRQTILFLTQSNAPHEKCHITGECTHCLKSFFVLFCFTR